MYKLTNKEIEVCKKVLVELDGFNALKDKTGNISGHDISNFLLVDDDLKCSFISKIVSARYNKLISDAIDDLTGDDDDGAVRVLDHIERFRKQVKNKYREYLNEKELKKMSNKLQLLKKKALKQLEIKNQYLKEISHGKGK